MNYDAHYERLMERARNRVLDGYTERHHIIALCMGGGNAASNLVRLTAEEHFVAHQLLVKMYPWHRSIAHAANLMASRFGGNKQYGWLRRRHAAAVLGTKHSQEVRAKMAAAHIGRTYQPCSKEAREKISRSNLGRKRSASTRAKMSLTMMGNKNLLGKTFTLETRAKMASVRKGKALTPEHCENIRRARLGKSIPEETRAKIAASLRGKPAVRSVEGAARIAAAARKRMLSDANPSKRRAVS